jgi:DnaJ-class molecular chaperone
MDNSFNSERNRTVFCPNCSGSGKYFYVDSGVNGCLLCGGAGLIRIEKGRMHEDNGTVQSFN